jgi:hypothetical protein
MALNRKRDPELEALTQQAAAELRAQSPELIERPRPYTNEEYAQFLADDAEIQRLWDEMDRHRGNAPQRYPRCDQ